MKSIDRWTYGIEVLGFPLNNPYVGKCWDAYLQLNISSPNMCTYSEEHCQRSMAKLFKGTRTNARVIWVTHFQTEITMGICTNCLI